MVEDFLTKTYVTLKGTLFSRAKRVLGDGEDARDALQDAFCKLWTKGYEVRSEQEAGALLSRAVQNTSMDTLRRRKEKTGIEDLKIADEPYPPDRSDLYKEVEEIVEKELTELQKQILRRKEFGGETLEEIARSLDMQPAAVRMQLSRARKAIRECYRQRNNE